MDIVNIVIMLLIGVFGGFISGLVGVGGAIIIYPAILLLPPLFGAPAYSAYIASGLTSSQVFFSTLSGSLKARKKTEFSPQLVLYMGGYSSTHFIKLILLTQTAISRKIIPLI